MTEKRKWSKEVNNEVYDKNGRPVHEYDVLKVFHFVGSRKKRYYMYKVVWDCAGWLRAMSPSEILRAIEGDIPGCLLSSLSGCNFEIVDGYGNDGVYYEDRPTKDQLDLAHYTNDIGI